MIFINQTRPVTTDRTLLASGHSPSAFQALNGGTGTSGRAPEPEFDHSHRSALSAALTRLCDQTCYSMNGLATVASGRKVRSQTFVCSNGRNS
jgi:hypothetical protein